MVDSSSQERILIIRMLEVGDVAAIGIPAIRYIQSKQPNAQIHFLTYADGADLIGLAEPSVKVMGLKHGEWPENIVLALETFLGFAEQIIGHAFTQIINLDTAFMPCFLARFLKDAGEPVAGNYMGMSVQELITQFQDQTLQADFVNNEAEYLQSTYWGMSRWHTDWWNRQTLPENGYPEFYLKMCCGYANLEFDNQIKVSEGRSLKGSGTQKRIIAMATIEPDSKMLFKRFEKKLSEKGYELWWIDPNDGVKNTLEKLKVSDLLISTPGAAHWYASAVQCLSLVVVGQIDPRLLMPDFATEQYSLPDADELVASVESIFDEQ